MKRDSKQKKTGLLTKAGNTVDDALRRLCGQLSPDMRVVVIIVMTLGFSALSIYFTVTGIYRFGKEEGMRMQIEHIGKPALPVPPSSAVQDSIRQEVEHSNQ
jgi:hypothetical protein